MNMNKKNFIKLLLKNKRFLFVISYIYSFPSYLKIRCKPGNKIYWKGTFFKKTKIVVIGKNNLINIHPENQLKNCLIYILGSNCSIEINEHCKLTNLELWIEDDNGIIEIGKRTTVEGGHFASTEGKEIKIGEDCMFSSNVEIRNGDSHSIFSKSTKKRINYAKSVYIGNHVWLGADSKVLKGSTIQSGSIVATGAIISGNVNENSIYAGVPAKLVKQDVFWLRER